MVAYWNLLKRYQWTDIVVAKMAFPYITAFFRSYQRLSWDPLKCNWVSVLPFPLETVQLYKIYFRKLFSVPWDTSLTIVRAVAPGERLPAFARQESPQGPHPCQPSMAGWELDLATGLLQGPVSVSWSRQPALHKEPGSTADLFHCSHQPSANSNVAIHSLTFWKSSIINNKWYVHKKCTHN